MLSKWPIRNKLLLGLALLLTIVGVLVYSGIHGLYAYRGLVKGLERRFDELPLAAELSQRVSDLRASASELRSYSGLRGVLGEPDSPGILVLRTQFDENLTAVEASLAAYRGKVERRGESPTPIGDSRRERETIAAMQTSLRRVRETSRDADWNLDAGEMGALASELTRMQSLAGQLPGLLTDDIQSFTDAVRGEYRTLITLAWATSVTTGMMLLAFVRLSYVWIFRPLRVLVKGSRRVAAGQFEYRIAVGTRDEMHELAEAMNDMTARFREIRDDLDQQVRERTKQVVRSEQLASVGFLAAGVAHEINNPLASIALCAESMERRLEEALDRDNPDHAVIRSYLGMIQDEAFRCKGITERLLDFSRIGQQQRQPTELGELVRGVIDMVGHLGKYQQQRIELLAAEPIVASVNAQEIKQVVLNLLTNGLDSLEPGGVVRVSLVRRREAAEIGVRDNGCGMTADVLEHLFEPFFTRRRCGQGTGLGLSISYRIVADHGGQIEARSDGPGRGSEFRVTLPLAVASPKESEHRHQAA